MHLGIDGSNIRGRGGVTHLTELLRASDPAGHGFDRITVWSNTETLRLIEDRSWLNKVQQPELEGGLISRIHWQHSKLSALLKQSGCDVLFVPGGSYSGAFRPYVTMSRNLIPFEKREIIRYGLSWQLMRNCLLRWSMSRSFRNADGLIFLTEYARRSVMKILGKIGGESVIIPHGVDSCFFRSPDSSARTAFSFESPFRILYVSLVDYYKHQWNVVEAVRRLRDANCPVRLDLIGPAYEPALKKLLVAISDADPEGKFITYHGPVIYESLPAWYHSANLFVFASSCENLPNTLLEAMASGLPNACSKRGPMPEILADAGLYFDPENVAEISSVVKAYYDSPDLRRARAEMSFNRASEFSWKKCAQQTLAFLSRFISD